MLGRLIAGAIALACAAATFNIVLLGSHLRLTATIPALLCLIALSLACGPAAWTTKIHSAIQSLRRSFVLADWQPPKRIAFLLAACGIGLGIWSLSSAWRLPTNLEETDQGAYLDTANQIHADGGVTSLVWNLYSGQFREANRHPFYLGLLSILPTQAWGKWLSTLAVVITVVGTALHLFRRGSLLASAFFLIWCSVNPALMKSAIMVGCEAWLMAWIAMVWWLMDAPCSTQIISDPLRTPQPGRTFLAGFALGLAWLTKGTALPLLPLTALWLLSQRLLGTRRISLCVVTFGLLVAGWITSAHPLLIRNVRAFHSPFHNVNSWLLFVDAFEDPVELSQTRPLGSFAQDYLRTHSVGELVARETNGLVWESFIVLRMLGVGSSNLSRAMTGGLVALLALLGASTSQRSAGQLTAIWTLTMVPLFAWYIPIAADDRFLVPFVPIWLAYGAEGAAGLVSVWLGRRAVEIDAS